MHWECNKDGKHETLIKSEINFYKLIKEAINKNKKVYINLNLASYKMNCANYACIIFF